MIMLFSKLLKRLGIKDAYQSSLIKVTFIDQQNNYELGYAMSGQEYLPVNILVPLHILVDKKAWIVVKANPVHALDYSFDKKLVLSLIPATDQNDIQSALASGYHFQTYSPFDQILENPAV